MSMNAIGLELLWMKCHKSVPDQAKNIWYSTRVTSLPNLQLKRTYRFRLQPNMAQQRLLLQFAGARRWVWNWALARRIAHFSEHKSSLSSADLSIELTALKKLPDTAWLCDVDSQLLQQPLRDLDSAYAHFFRRVKQNKLGKGTKAVKVGYPRFKSRKIDTPRFRIPQRVKLLGERIYVPKLGFVAIKVHRPVDGDIKSATFKRDPSGHWHVTLVSHFTMPDVPIPMPADTKADTVGFDLGLKDFVALSEGERVAAPKFYRHAERKLRRANKSLHRKHKGSANRAKARVRLARVHAKTANKRRDFLHKLSTRIISTYSAVCIEDLNVRGLAGTSTSIV
jgi:putative transposase